MTRKRLLFVQPVLDPPGGSNAVASWMIEALKGEYAISVLTWRPPDLAAINRFYGTALRESDFSPMTGPPILRALFRLDPDPDSIQPSNYLLRIGKKIADDFDLIVSANNEADFGRPSIQYVHYPYLASSYARFPHSCGETIGRRVRALLRREIRPWMFISDFSFDRMKGNLSLVNSEWTGRRFRDLYGIEPVTLYPPVPGAFPHVPWEEREDGFVCIGRIHPGKRLDWIIETIARTRRIAPRLRLHIVGTRGQKPEEVMCLRRLAPLLEANSSWVHLHEDLPRDELANLAARQRYGIHAQVDEHFGIAPAEMVRAGCITFVHDSGGQVEIVGNDPRLTFDSTEQAVERISAVVSDPGRQADLVEFLSTRKDLFSTERFVAELWRVVRQWCERRALEFNACTAKAGVPKAPETVVGSGLSC